ncbi:MAG: phytoene/squalene synthase family protein [Bryobacteraceae bacterium]|nr:phytoene/squalene synthase family protein [Bryobacteraceae bacterium]
MTLHESYAYCTGVARSRAKNFYYSFLLLDADRRKAMCAVYAFMRYCDDLSDDLAIADRAGAIARWSQDLEGALAGQVDSHPLWPAFHDTVRRYRIPHEYFREMIAGVSSDLEPRRMETFDELYRYCYQVASVVGLTIIHIFGFEDRKALELAEKCGVAFQLTNILRDVKEDAALGRVYLPGEDLRRFGVTGFTRGPQFRELMRFEAARARGYYEESRALVDLVHPGTRASLRALIAIYRRLLERIEAADYDVLSRRIRLPAWEKLYCLARSRFAL